MQIIDDKTVVVTTSEEFKKILSEDNKYVYIYFGNDITLDSGFTINSNKQKIIIDGTYQNHEYTYSNYLSEMDDIITASSTNHTIVIKNLIIKSSHSLGVIYVPDDINYRNVKVIYSKVKFNGVKLSYNPYGIIKILNSEITVEDTNNVSAQRICDCNQVEIGGKTTLVSPNTAFSYQHTIDPALFTILINSRVSLNTTNAFFNGTPRLDFRVLYNSEFNLVTGNGFAQTLNNGCRNVLIDECSTFNFVENNHQRVPMWNVYGDFIINEGASLFIINTFANAPVDNYNIYFKGTNQNFIINNPKNITIYNKNANILYTTNPVKFSFTFNRLNMWQDSIDIAIAGSIDNLPDYSWYKDDNLSEISGIFDKNTTTIIKTNYTEEEKRKLPSLDKFIFQNKKEFSIGMIKVNIHPIDNASIKISGHTMANTDVLIAFDDISEVVTSNVDGLFEYILEEDIKDGTNIKVIVCTPTSFIYNTRDIITPFDGEVTLLKSTEVATFDNIPMTLNPVILRRTSSSTVTVVDSRKNSNSWNLYISYLNPMMSKDAKVLSDSLIFKKFDNETFMLRTSPTFVYQGVKASEDVSVENITFSKDRGLLLRLDGSTFNLNDEYATRYIWTIELE